LGLRGGGWEAGGAGTGLRILKLVL